MCWRGASLRRLHGTLQSSSNDAGDVRSAPLVRRATGRSFAVPYIRFISRTTTHNGARKALTYIMFDFGRSGSISKLKLTTHKFPETAYELRAQLCIA